MNLSLPELLDKYSDLVSLVRADHKKAGFLFGTGHDFSHALMVAQYSLKLTATCTQKLSQKLVWIACILHNTDRLYPEWNDQQLTQKLLLYLDTVPLISNLEKDLIVEAVLRHSEKPLPGDNPITVILMDSDKLGIIGPQMHIQAAQFRPQLPPINFAYLEQYPPGCDYKNPGSVFRDLISALEWEGGFEHKGQKYPWIRTEKARELAQPLFKKLRSYLSDLLKQYEEVGLLPYPFLEDFE